MNTSIRTAIIFFSIAIIYYITSLNLIIKPIRGYNTAAESLIKGKLNLDIPVPNELLKLKNPYDPYLNQEIRIKDNINDYSLYKGKLYFYFGIVPTILFYIPYQLIFHNYLIDNIVVLIFSLLSILTLFNLFLLLKERYFNDCPENKIKLSLTTLGISSGYLILCNRPLMYEVAIASSSFFLILSIYILCKDINNLNKRSLMIIGTILGLSISCKVSVIFSSIALISCILYKLSNDLKKNYLKVFFLLTPFSLIILLLALYNYLRFNNLLEFGARYSLSTVNYQKEPLFSMIYFLRNLNWYFFLPPIFRHESPYIFLNHCKPSTFYPLKEPMISFIIISPFILTVLCKKAIRCIQTYRELLIILIPGGINLIIFLFYNYVSIRFLAEFVPLFILGSLVIWCIKPLDKKGNIPEIISYTLLIITILFNMILF